ncbi:MAG: alpha/beta hydrolase [Microthrixaceae bacterium]
MTDGSAAQTGDSTQPDSTQQRSPAPVETSSVDGLAVNRRRHPDVDPARPTVFLVHGAMDRAASFGRVMRRLVEFDVITYDRSGYAGSGPTSQTDQASQLGRDPQSVVDPHVAPTVPLGGLDAISGHAEDLRRLIEWSGAAHAVVVGHSLGGTVALALAAREHREQAKALDPSQGRGAGSLVALGVFESPAPWLDGSFSSVGRGAIEVADTQGDEAGAEHFYRLMIGERTFARLRDRDKAARRAEGPALIAELRALRDPSLAIDLSTVTIPTIIGTGSTSSTSLRHGAQLITEALPDAWGVEIAGAGHGAHLTHPDEFAAYVRACAVRGEVRVEQSSGASGAGAFDAGASDE